MYFAQINSASFTFNRLEMGQKAVELGCCWDFWAKSCVTRNDEGVPRVRSSPSSLLRRSLGSSKTSFLGLGGSLFWEPRFLNLLPILLHRASVVVLSFGSKLPSLQSYSLGTAWRLVRRFRNLGSACSFAAGPLRGRESGRFGTNRQQNLQSSQFCCFKVTF